MAVATKKIARRILKRVNGVLTVVFVDANTGEVLNNTDGYEFESADGMPGITTPTTPKTAEEAATEPAPRSSNNTSNDQGHKDWLAKRTPDDDGNPFDEVDKQMATVQGGIDNVKGTLTNGIMGLGARLFGGAIGENIGKGIAEDIKENGVTGAGDAVRAAGANIQDTVGGFVGGLFGGGSETPTQGAYSPLQNPKGVTLNPQLEAMLNEAALRSPYAVVVKSGEREGDTRQHGQNNAVDINLVNPDTGEVLPDYQNGPAFRVYEQFAQTVRTVQQNMFPEVEQDLRWGGYFTANGSPKGYGAADLMHFDLAGQTVGWGAGGNWKDGAAGVLRQAYPGLESKGMGNQRWALTEPGVSPVPEIQTAEASKPTVKDKGPGAYPQVAPAGVNPNLLAAVEARKAASKVPAVQATQVAQTPPQPGVINPTTNLGDQVAMAPIQGGSQAAPMFDARYDPVAQQTMMLPEQERVSSQGLEMGQIMQPEVKIADAGFMNTPTSAPVMAGLDQQEGNHYLDALLKTLNEAEGSPTANSLFGYGEVDDLSQHPNQKVAYNNGNDFSTAAGLFQINKATWDEYSAKAGVPDFSEASQWEVARRIAIDEYKGDTGRDLVADLATGNRGMLEQAYSSLANRWASLPKGVQPNSKMNDLLTSFETHSAFKEPAVKANAPTAFAGPDYKAKNTKWDSEPVSVDSVTKISKPTAPTTGGFMGPQNTPKNSPVSQSSGSGELSGPNKISTPRATPTASPKQASSGGFVSRPTTSAPTSTTTKISSAKTTTPAPTKDKSASTQTTVTNTKTSNTNKDKSKGKN